MQEEPINSKCLKIKEEESLSEICFNLTLMKSEWY